MRTHKHIYFRLSHNPDDPFELCKTSCIQSWYEAKVKLALAAATGSERNEEGKVDHTAPLRKLHDTPLLPPTHRQKGQAVLLFSK